MYYLVGHPVEQNALHFFLLQCHTELSSYHLPRLCSKAKDQRMILLSRNNVCNIPSLLLLLLLVSSAENISLRVFDHLLSQTELKSAEKLFTRNETKWKFEDIYQSKGGDERTHFWTSLLDLDEFLQSSIWRVIHEGICMRFLCNYEFQPYKVEAQISSRGDAIKNMNSCTGFVKNSDSNFHVILFLVDKNWKKNDYGELVVYGSNGEIIQGIHAIRGRVVVIPCGYRFTLKPPGMANSLRHRTLKIQASTSKNPLHSPRNSTYKVQNLKRQENIQMFGYLPREVKHRDVPIESYITRKYSTKDGKPVVVFDNFLPDTLVKSLELTINEGEYSDFPPEIGSTDNVPWILPYEVEFLVKTSLWSYVQQLLSYVTGKKGYYPYDVSCNAIRSFDHTTIHTDCGSHENDFTVLIYLNRNWAENSHGETVFFADNTSSEIVCAVRPKLGRVAIFHGHIPHCARPPVSTFFGVRYTLAIKTAPSKAIAEKKLLDMDLDPLYQALVVVSEEQARNIKQFINEAKEGRKTHKDIEQEALKYEKLMEET
ncbi:predicted protein [Nematostella vectensis]|uniref:Prolyl 4-hydroxylase alpha subunit domain-containing protein n=1 Tax=Nematostella vectensis TaxID=45351 RepID=A7SKD0_NEMVE|nr:predicted protein [Nematostella vectensis]|eukprot:XP_001627877.1 predicted protein [Nematostella vectensis]